MGDLLSAFEKLPAWQRAAAFFVGLLVLGTAWYFLFYRDAVAERESAQAALDKAELELSALEAKKQNFLERQRKQAELEAALQSKIEVLPMSIASVDNLMQTFQQQARLVGMTVESWSPGGEIKEDYVARLPVQVRAVGSWAQVGEFFRRVSELDRIVSVDKITLAKSTRTQAQRKDDPNAPVDLAVTFEAATYRFLSEAERGAGAKTKASRKRKK